MLQITISPLRQDFETYQFTQPNIVTFVPFEIDFGLSLNNFFFSKVIHVRTLIACIVHGIKIYYFCFKIDTFIYFREKKVVEE